MRRFLVVWAPQDCNIRNWVNEQALSPYLWFACVERSQQAPVSALIQKACDMTTRKVRQAMCRCHHEAIIHEIPHSPGLDLHPGRPHKKEGQSV